ncbi:MAG: hypothetical protein ACK4SY_07620 [Pyrobaculum sp.]
MAIRRRRRRGVYVGTGLLNIDYEDPYVITQAYNLARRLYKSGIPPYEVTISGIVDAIYIHLRGLKPVTLQLDRYFQRQFLLRYIQSPEYREALRRALGNPKLAREYAAKLLAMFYGSEILQRVKKWARGLTLEEYIDKAAKLERELRERYLDSDVSSYLDLAVEAKRLYDKLVDVWRREEGRLKSSLVKRLEEVEFDIEKTGRQMDRETAVVFRSLSDELGKALRKVEANMLKILNDFDRVEFHIQHRGQKLMDVARQLEFVYEVFPHVNIEDIVNAVSNARFEIEYVVNELGDYYKSFDEYLDMVNEARNQLARLSGENRERVRHLEVGLDKVEEAVRGLSEEFKKFVDKYSATVKHLTSVEGSIRSSAKSGIKNMSTLAAGIPAGVVELREAANEVERLYNMLKDVQKVVDTYIDDILVEYGYTKGLFTKYYELLKMKKELERQLEWFRVTSNEMSKGSFEKSIKLNEDVMKYVERIREEFGPRAAMYAATFLLANTVHRREHHLDRFKDFFNFVDNVSAAGKAGKYYVLVDRSGSVMYNTYDGVIPISWTTALAYILWRDVGDVVVRFFDEVVHPPVGDKQEFIKYMLPPTSSNIDIIKALRVALNEASRDRTLVVVMDSYGMEQLRKNMKTAKPLLKLVRKYFKDVKFVVMSETYKRGKRVFMIDKLSDVNKLRGVVEWL